MSKNSAIGAVVAVLVIAGGVYALTRKSSDDSKKVSTTTPATVTPTKSDATAGSDLSQLAPNTINYVDAGFGPDNLSVKAGTTITIKNSSTSEIQFASDPHPAHTDNTELNVGLVAGGASKSFTVTKVGVWKFHNHLNPNQTGQITVQ